MPNTKHWALITIHALLAILSFIIICESAVRFFDVETFRKNSFFLINRDLDYPDVMLRDSDLFWKLRPGQTIVSEFFDGDTIRTNAIGLRGAEIDQTKNRLRVVALGNSCTFGWGIGEDSTFAAQLEKLLGPECEVINAGIPGYSSYQGKVFWEKTIAKLQPDILLVLFAWNDHWPAGKSIADKDQQFPSAFVVALQNQLSRLHSYRLLRKVLLDMVESDSSAALNLTKPVLRVEPRDFSENLKEICRAAVKQGATPILLTSPIPSLEQIGGTTRLAAIHNYHQQYNREIKILAEESAVTLVDLATQFDKHRELFDRPVYDPIHFNARGHLLAAELIFEAVKTARP